MRQPAHVVKVEGVFIAGVVDFGDVARSIVSRVGQILLRTGHRQSRRQFSLCRSQSEIKFGCPQLHIVVPNVFGIAIERRDGQQTVGIATAAVHRVRRIGQGSVRQRENVFGVLQRLLRSRWIRGSIKLVILRECRCHSACEIRTDLRSSGRGDESGTVADIEIVCGAVLVIVSRLRQRPNVILGFKIGKVLPVLTVVHLVVKSFAAVVPHLHKPVEAELSLLRKVRRRGSSRCIARIRNRNRRRWRILRSVRSHLFGKIANANFHECSGIAHGLHIFHVVAGIPPAAIAINDFSG